METCILGLPSAVPSLTTLANPAHASPSQHYLHLHPCSPPPSLTLTQQQLCKTSPSQSRRDFLGFLGLLPFGLVLHSPLPDALASPLPCELTVTPSGLAFCDTTPGSGLQASKGMLIKANYVGKLENGKVFDSSYDRGRPLTFRVGVGEVIKGWDQGILGGEGVPPMLAGGRRTLKIPPQLAYGERGAGCRGGFCVIPPNSVLLFDVEFVGKV